MAFGDIRGTKTGNATSVTATNACATGTDFAVVVGDIIVAVFAQEAAVTVTTCIDNLGNTYSPLGAGLDAGTIVTGRGYYTRVTNPGTISSLTFAASASTNNYACCAVGFEGPFAASPLDAQPAGIVNDLTTPYTCPPTGTLAQASEKIVCAIVVNGNPTLTATAPNLKAVEINTATVLKVAIGHQTVSSTASVTPAWTSSVVPTQDALDTVSFKAAVTHADSRTEPAATADSVASTQIAIASRTEAAATADAATADVPVITGNRAVISWIELSGAAQIPAAIVEAAATASNQAAAQVQTTSRTEAAVTADASAANQAQLVSRIELAATATIEAANQVQTAARIEAAVSATTQAGTGDQTAARIEAAATSDSASAVVPAVVHTADCVETVATGDSQSALYIQVADRLEIAVTSDATTSPSVGGDIWVKHEGTWKIATVHVKHGGVWKQPTQTWVKHLGEWKPL